MSTATDRASAAAADPVVNALTWGRRPAVARGRLHQAPGDSGRVILLRGPRARRGFSEVGVEAVLQPEQDPGWFGAFPSSTR